MEQSDQHQIGMHTRNYLPIYLSHSCIIFSFLIKGRCVSPWSDRNYGKIMGWEHVNTEKLNEELGGRGISHTNSRLREYPIRFLLFSSSREGKGCNCNLNEILRSRAWKGHHLTMRNYSTARVSILFCQLLGSLNLLGVEGRRLKTLGSSSTIWMLRS
jgi:hypothetical protein